MSLSKKKFIYKHGALCRIELKNFMTFDEIEIKAGPSLNLILAPNGCGKSAIVCGIILGLGGDPTSTGRAGTLIEYVQFGKDLAQITIELMNKNGKNFLIQRILTVINKKKPDVKSEWTLNGSKASLQEIKNFVYSLNIFIDNLCQFLPQEKVVEFVKMNSQQLLTSTQKAVGNKIICDNHNNLIELCLQKRQLLEKFQELRKELDSKEKTIVHLEDQVKRIDERNDLEEKYNLYLIKKPWLEYDEARVEHSQLKKKVKGLEKDLKNKTQLDLPLETTLTDKKKNLEVYNSFLDKMDIYQTDHVIENFQNEIYKLDREIKSKKSYYLGQIELEKEQKIKLEKLIKQLEVFETQLNSCPDVNILKEEVKNLEQEAKIYVTKGISMHNEINRKKAVQIKTNDNLHEIKTRLKQEADVYQKRMTILKDTDEKTYRVARWLEKNQDKFEAKVYPPIMVNINVKKSSYTKFVECCIAKRDLFAFVFKNKHDIYEFNKLVVKEFGYRVSLVVSPDKKPSEFYSQSNKQNLESLGFTSLISEMFTCTDDVMSYLLSTYQLHNIPFTVKEIDSDDLEKKNIFLKKYISNNCLVQMHSSRYTSEIFTEIRQIGNSNFLNIIYNEEKVEELKKELLQHEEDLVNLNNELSSLNEEFEKNQTTLSSIKEKINIKTSKINELQLLINQIDLQKSKIQNHKESIVDLDEEKEKLKKCLKEFFPKKFNIFKKFKLELSKLTSINNDFILTCIKQECVFQHIKCVESIIEYSKVSFKQLEEELKKSKELLVQKFQDAKEKLSFAHQATKTNENAGLPASFKKQFDSITDDLDELNSEIRKLSLRLNLLTTNSSNDSRTKTYYNQNKEIITRMKKEIQQLEIKIETISNNINEIKTDWLVQINELIEKININFENFMQRLKLGGKIELKIGNNEENFDQYGISILVKYRKKDNLEELNWNVHSGGERSVATMVYMIALQELTNVPFRVVDEINQGMDDTNERNVFNLLMNIADQSASQYFLLSPKLLRNLEFSDKMHIHFIFNGPYFDTKFHNESLYKK